LFDYDEAWSRRNRAQCCHAPATRPSAWASLAADHAKSVPRVQHASREEFVWRGPRVARGWHRGHERL